MKKFGVILLAMVFIFGLTAQAGAGVEWFTDKEVFYDGEPAEDEPITFDYFEDLTAIESGTALTTQFSGVEFQGVEIRENVVLYKDYFLSMFFYGLPHTAINFDPTNDDWIYNPINGPVVKANFEPMVTRVVFNAMTPDLHDITVTVYRDGVETGSQLFHAAIPEGTMIFVGVKDSEGIDAIEISGDGQFYEVVNALFIDNFGFGGTPDNGPADIKVEVEIKPPNCLDDRIRINDKSQGVTPVVIISGETYDVTEIDPSTVLLQGVPPVRDAIEDASLCNEEKGDGDLDLALKFNTQELVEAMGVSKADVQAMENGEWPSKSLQLTGNLFEESGGTAIKGKVSVTLVGKVKEDKENKGKGKNN